MFGNGVCETAAILFKTGWIWYLIQWQNYVMSKISKVLFVGLVFVEPARLNEMVSGRLLMCHISEAIFET